MKKIIALTLCVCLSLFLFTACDDDNGGNNNGTSNTSRMTADSVDRTTPRVTSNSTPDVSDTSDMSTPSGSGTSDLTTPNGSDTQSGSMNGQTSDTPEASKS